MAEQHLEVPSRLDQIEHVCRIVGQAAVSAGFDRRTAYACQLAVNEACENIIKHGYAEGAEGQIRVTAHSRPGELTVELEDTAPPFNPAEVPLEPDWTAEDPPVGGLGLVIIHRVMDEVTYRRRRGRNWLRLVRRAREPRREEK